MTWDTGPKWSDDNPYSGLALAIRKARKKAGLTQEALAKKLGIVRSRLAQWETGKRQVPMAEIPKIRGHLPGADGWTIRKGYSPGHGAVARLVSDQIDLEEAIGDQ